MLFNNLLEYSPTHRVLICHECRYAVQKSAVSSHLLKHKIYRGNRQGLLALIAELDILEPHDVPLPEPTSPPIDPLPVISGYRCTASTGCGNLCASSKRLSRHWKDVHGISEQVSEDMSLAQQVKLQTFFRGTKLRYFEVTPHTDTTFSLTEDISGSLEESDTSTDGHRAHDIRMTNTRGGHRPRPKECLEVRREPRNPAVNLDLDTLTYFHHFTAYTAFTLPDDNHSLFRPTMNWWMDTLVPLALQRSWLMCGLLAISACHLATLKDDALINKSHIDNYARFRHEFDAETVRKDVSIDNNEVKRARERMRCILNCVHGSVTGSGLGQSMIRENMTDCSQLRFILTVFQDWSKSAVGEGTDDTQQADTFLQAKRVLERRASPSTDDTFARLVDVPSTDHGIPSSAAFNRLRNLPYRMAEVFGKPDNPGNVITTLSAIAELVLCCDAGFPSANGVMAPEAAWCALVMWPNNVLKGRFGDMLMEGEPAALVVMAHWAAILVKKAEQYFWFLKGQGLMVYLLTVNVISHDEAVQGLVAGLISS